jgi:hypothetical protein
MSTKSRQTIYGGRIISEDIRTRSRRLRTGMAGLQRVLFILFVAEGSGELPRCINATVAGDRHVR